MNLNYTTGIPDTPNNPTNDQPAMKTNTNSINSIIQIDHHGFKDNLGGYHTIIHQDAQVTDPANIPGPPQINQVYVKSYTPDTTGGVADTQLFTRTALGAISQLTGYLSGLEGYQWIGGVLVQWGQVATTATSGTETFKDRAAGAIPFPNNCWNVSLTLSSSGVAGVVPLAVIAVRTFSATQFKWKASGLAASNMDGFYWMAIGN